MKSPTFKMLPSVSTIIPAHVDNSVYKKELLSELLMNLCALIIVRFTKESYEVLPKFNGEDKGGCSNVIFAVLKLCIKFCQNFTGSQT